MKKGLRIAACLVAAALFFSCANSANVEENAPATVEDNRTLTQKISDATGTVDFKGNTIAEDAVVSKKITIKNLNMDGKTLTVNTTGVELENVKNAVIILAKSSGNDAVKLTNCKNIITLKVEDGSTNNLTIDASDIKSIEINNDGVKITLKDKTNVSEVAVKADGATIDSVKTSSGTAAEAPVIENIKVDNTADGVTVSGGTIEAIKVDAKEGETTSTPAINITGETEIKDITVTVDGEENEDAAVTVNVSEEIAETIKLPDANVDFNTITFSAISTIDTTNAKKYYTVGEEFDYSGLNAILKYSNGSEKTIPLTTDNSTVTGFVNSTAGKYPISITYTYDENHSANINLTIYVRQPELTNGTSAEYINAALEKLTVGTPDYDGAVAYFKKAYESDKDSDEAKLYYALAELASISTDASVAKLVKENFGFKNYPATMNALFSTEWLRTYAYTTYMMTFKIEAQEDGAYIRVDGKETSNRNSDAQWFDYYLNGDVWVSLKADRHQITNIKPSENGKYLIWAPNKWSDKEYSKYRYSVTQDSYQKCLWRMDDSTGPELNIPEGIENNENYKATLYNSIQTSETVSYLMLMNIFTCNANGFNSLIDNCLNVFGSRYENAKKLVASINQESITVPAEVIAALKLDKFFGEDTVKIGKAEAQVLFAAGDIFKGLFQWFSSYDLSLNIGAIPAEIDEYYKDPNGGMYKNNPAKYEYIKTQEETMNSWADAAVQYFTRLSASRPEYQYWVQQENEKFTQRMMETLSVVINGNTLKVRNASAMEASKNTIAGALDTVLESYEYITVTSETYPSGIKDKIKQYGDPISAMVDAAKDAIEKGEIFEFPSPVQAVSVEIDSEGKETIVKADPQMLSVDFGKLFKAGYFSNVFVKDKDENYSINMELIADLLPFLASQQQ